ncbi:MAG: guanylate kinase [Planctomycetota bacterium]
MGYPRTTDSGLMVVLSGPSGAGKSSLIGGFLARRGDFAQSVSATTRAPRPGEREGHDYFFLDETAFTGLIETDGLLEHATVFGQHRYGTPRAFVEERLARGQGVIADVDVQGAQQIRQNMPTAVQVFVIPPDEAELERRLRGRGTESDAAVARRLDEARLEIACWQRYDYLLINDELDRAVDRLDAIVCAESLRTTRAPQAGS